MADTDSLERIRKALEDLESPPSEENDLARAMARLADERRFAAACNPVAIRSLLAREAALRARLDALDNLPAEDFIRKVARQMGLPPFDTWPVSHVCQQNADEAAELVAAYDEIARAALASTEPT